MTHSGKLFDFAFVSCFLPNMSVYVHTSAAESSADDSSSSTDSEPTRSITRNKAWVRLTRLIIAYEHVYDAFDHGFGAHPTIAAVDTVRTLHAANPPSPIEVAKACTTVRCLLEKIIDVVDGVVNKPEDSQIVGVMDPVDTNESELNEGLLQSQE